MTLDTLTIGRVFNQSSRCVRDIQTSCYNTFNLRPGTKTRNGELVTLATVISLSIRLVYLHYFIRKELADDSKCTPINISYSC